MPKLILCRHGQSEWNAKNLFTGWKMFNYLNKDEMKQLLGRKLKKMALS